MKRPGGVIFVIALSVATALYGLTLPDSLPWRASASLTTTVSLAAFASGLLGSLVCRHLGWRCGIAAALGWTFSPAVWDRVVTGNRDVCLAAAVVIGLWTLNAVLLWVTRRAREMRPLPTEDEEGPRSRRNRILAWTVVGCATIFSLVSLLTHDYWLGEAASVYAQGVVEQAGGRILVMNGSTTTLPEWERRWTAFKPCLGSHDRFVRVGRRLFAMEALSIANERNGEAAYSLYRRVEEEIDPGNVSALINMSVMIRCGYAPGTQEESRVCARLEELRKDPVLRSRIREVVRAAGPIRSNPALLEKLVAEARRQVAGKFATGEKVEISPRVLTLVEWSNEMCRLMDAGEVEKAGRLARKILSNPDWRGFIPANAVMGSVASREGDYIASEVFFRVATDTTNRVETVVLNNYADTLMHLGKLDEAEAVARRAVGQSDDAFWLARLTLAEVLERKGEKEEAKTLFRSVLRHAPDNVGAKVRRRAYAADK